MRFTGELAALGTAFCWSVSAIVFEAAGRRVGSLPVNLIRLLLAAVFLGAYLAISRGDPLPTDASLHAWIWLSVSGLVGFTIGDLLLFRALVEIGSRLSMLLMSLVPPMTALIGWLLLGETLTPLDWLGMTLTLGGVTWVVLERLPDETGRHVGLPLRGVLLGIGGAAGQAVGLVLSKYGMGRYDAVAATQIRVLAGIAGFVVIFLGLGWLGRVSAALRDRRAMGHTSLGAFFGPFLGVSLSLVAVKHTQAGVAATLMALVPVTILLPTVLLNKERVTLRAALGAGIAVSGAALLFLK